MIVADFLVDFLIKKKITDIFGIPGGVILEFLYAIDRRKKLIKPHLNFHEQNSIFSACGYAIAGKKLGVVYATRGPGITNMITGISDAYYDSVPIMIITAHSSKNPYNNMRIFSDQEINTSNLFSGITKYYARIDNSKNIQYKIEKAYHEAMNGRKGPVLLDFDMKVFFETIEIKKTKIFKTKKLKLKNYKNFKQLIKKKISNSKRPIFLVGDGLRYTNKIQKLLKISKKNNIPILSSRFSQDLISQSKYFFGYLGSHGLRYSNFILSKSDLIISLGNRNLFLNNKSKSFRKIFKNNFIVRVDLDKAEFTRKVSNSINYNIDASQIINEIEKIKINHTKSNEWLKTCNLIKKELFDEDFSYPITVIEHILKVVPKNYIIVSDVGNNEYWLSRAYAHSGCKNTMIFSKSFGAMGSSIGKAIGAYYATLKPVLCFIGDQALQMCIQELHYVAKHFLPITIVLLNNRSSGMIRSRQKWRYNNKFLHTTPESGYSVPNFDTVVKSYGIKFYKINILKASKIKKNLFREDQPKMLEIKVDPKIEMIPHLPFGFPVQKLLPALDEKKYNWLDNL